MNLYRNNLTIGDIPQLDVVPGFFPKTGLVSYYKLDGNSNDSVGSNNGTDTSINYSSSYGKINQGAYNAGGGSIRKIAVPSSASLISPTNNITISLWVKLGSLVNQTVPLTMRILPDPTPPYNSYLFELAPSGSKAIVFSVFTSSVKEVNSSTVLNTNTWYHLTGTYNGSYIRLYLNGSLIGETAQTGNINYGSNRELRITSNSTGNGQFFTGSIDEVGIWSRALTSDEITKLYNNGNGLTY